MAAIRVGLVVERGPYWPTVHFDDDQRGALRTGAPRDTPNELLHLVLGLVGDPHHTAAI